MSENVRLVVLAGSLRAGSYNKKLARVGADALRTLGAEVDLLDLRDFPMPCYDGDLEAAEGLPEGVLAFKARLATAQGFLFSSPEYNHSIPGTFKNAIDWASRGDEDVFDGKVAALMAASPGGFGGMRGLPHLRQVLTALGIWLVPAQVTLAKAADAFDAEDRLTSDFIRKQVNELAGNLLEAVRRQG